MKTFLFSIFLLAFHCLLIGQETPPVIQFPTDIYQAENQNWDIAQADNKFMYFANNAGLLEFNGADWALHPSPNGTILRSLFIHENKIYTGAYREFGFWEKDSIGILKYNSLSATIKDLLKGDENFWNINFSENTILFQSYERIYFYNLEDLSIEILESEDGYYRIFNLNQEVLIHRLGGNIFKLENGKESLFAEIPVEFGIQLVLNIFEKDNAIILITRKKGLFKVQDGIVSKWNFPDEGKLEDIQIFCGGILKDESILLGSISKGIYQITPAGLINAVNDLSNGLSNNTVLDLFEDVEGNVWAALDNGIDCINLNSNTKVFSDQAGEMGATYCAELFNDYLYLGTNQGLFRKKYNYEVPFELVQGTEGQVWSLFNHNGELFCGHTYGTFIILGNTSKLIFEKPGTWAFKVFPNRDDLLLTGHYAGMSTLRKVDGQWQGGDMIQGFDISARFFEFSSPDEIYVNHEYKGIFKLKIAADASEFIEVELLPEKFKGKGSGLVKVNNDILYCNENGIYKLDENSKQFEFDSSLVDLSDRSKYASGKLIFDQIKQRLWLFNQDNIRYTENGLLPDQKSIKTISIKENWRKNILSFENISYLNENKYLIGKWNGYYIIDLDKVKNIGHEIHLNHVEVKSKNNISHNVSIAAKGNFPIQSNSISFEYSVPKYDKYHDILFQYKLEGLNDSWSDWLKSSTKAFEKLEFGEYTFNVRSKSGDRISDNIAKYNFKINKPAYLTLWAIATYIILTLFLAYFTNRTYKKYYSKEHDKLRLQNKRTLELQELHNEQKIVKLKNERLHQDIENKNRELAITTMSINKRNEVLKGIRKEIEKNDAITNKKEVLKLIDNNLNQEEDWKFFKEAFDNADKDFLKRAKEKHPNLTHNDLKLCAYLRLNLSSKEIAPALNISVKSVEVKRSRLRKKIELEREKSLADYILSI